MAFKMKGMHFGHGTGSSFGNSPMHITSSDDTRARQDRTSVEGQPGAPRPLPVKPTKPADKGTGPFNMGGYGSGKHPLHMTGGRYDMMEGGQGSPQKILPLIVGTVARAVLPHVVRGAGKLAMRYATRNIPKAVAGAGNLIKYPTGAAANVSRMLYKGGRFITHPFSSVTGVGGRMGWLGDKAISWGAFPSLLGAGYTAATGSGKPEEDYVPEAEEQKKGGGGKGGGKSGGKGGSGKGGGPVVHTGGPVPTTSKELQDWIKANAPKPKRESSHVVVPGVSDTRTNIHRRGSIAGTKKMETKKDLVTGAVTTTKTKGKSTMGIEGKKIKSTTVLPGGTTIKKKEKYGRKITGEGDAGDWWSGRRKKSKTTVRTGDLVIKTKRKKSGKVIVKTRKKGGLFSKRTRIS